MKKFVFGVWFLSAVVSLFALAPTQSENEIWEIAGHDSKVYSEMIDHNDSKYMMLLYNVLLSGAVSAWAFGLIGQQKREEGNEEAV